MEAARTAGTEPVQEGEDIRGHKVLSAYAPVWPFGWRVFVELPVEEAYASHYNSIKRSGAIIFTGSGAGVSARALPISPHGGPARLRLWHTGRITPSAYGGRVATRKGLEPCDGSMLLFARSMARARTRPATRDWAIM